ncbi:MAG: hypothetical protein ACREHV_15015 [Rhizomicrobium sp.]
MILDTLYNFHWIEAGKAARSSQAYAGCLGAFLRAHGIRALINLRGRNPGHLWWRHETRVCASQDIVHRDAKLNSRQLPTPAMLADLLGAFDATPRPLLLKCSGGQDRASFASALYVLHAQGWQAFGRAERQFARWPYLHWPTRQQRWLRLFLDFARERAAERPIRNWIENGYSAHDFRFWLEERGEGRSFHGLYDVPGSVVGRSSRG